MWKKLKNKTVFEKTYTTQDLITWKDFYTTVYDTIKVYLPSGYDCPVYKDNIVADVHRGMIWYGF